MDALAVVVCEISTHELTSNLAFFLTSSFSEPCVVQTPDFRKMLLSSSQSTTQNLDALIVVVHEISNHELMSNLAFLLTLNISIPFVVQTSTLRKCCYVQVKVPHSSWGINPWINNIFSFFSNFKHIHTICSSDNRLWENVGIDNFCCDFGCHNVLSWILLSFTNIELQVNLTFGSLIFTRTVNFLLQKNPFPTSKMTAKRYSIPYIQLLLSSHIFSPEVGEPLIFFGKHFFTFPSPHVGAMAPGHFYEEWKWLRVCFGSRLPEMELKRAYKYSIYIKNKA